MSSRFHKICKKKFGIVKQIRLSLTFDSISLSMFVSSSNLDQFKKICCKICIENVSSAPVCLLIINFSRAVKDSM